MAHKIVELECPGCGVPITTGTRQCPQCFREIVITTFHSVYSMALPEVNKYANSYRKALAEDPEHKEWNRSIAFCYLKLKLYDQALSCFEKAMEDNFDHSETYFYAAVCLLKGKKAFLAPRDVINKIEEYLNAALMIEPKGIYYYFQAYIKYDYFERKSFYTSPTWQEAFVTAEDTGLSETDVMQLYGILGVEKPSCL